MSLANFFPKSALAAASLFRQFDAEAFRQKLEHHVVGIAFDEAACTSAEGSATLELLIELVARLYPALAVLPLGSVGPSLRTMADRLTARASGINPDIELRADASGTTAIVVVGHTAVDVLAPVVYVGSSGWRVLVSAEKPAGSGSTTNPFGAGAAACLGAATIFRIIFATELRGTSTSPNTDTDVIDEANVLRSDQDDEHEVLAAAAVDLSLLDLGRDPGPQESAALPSRLPIGETFLVGVGAIGWGAVWALARCPGLDGRLHLIDGESIAPSNLQRYVLTTQASIGQSKVALASAVFANRMHRTGNALEVQAHQAHWAPYVASRDTYLLDRVLLALDSAEDRIAVQASLPRWIVNAWTQPENLGVSRHPSLHAHACVACLYFPQGQRKSKDVLYAEALRIQGGPELMEVRQLLHTGQPVGYPFLERVAQRLGVSVEPLAQFADRPLDAFYTEALCGGIVLQLGGSVGAERNTEVPMAFQSVLAGILLAAELVVDAAGLRASPLPCRTELDLRRSLGTRLNSPAAKLASGRCLCQDPIYARAYDRKYGPAVGDKVPSAH